MGIKSLNSFIKNNCPKSIKTMKLSALRGKKIVIDTSIYMYKFIRQKSLLINFYILCQLCISNNITPIFIFDGKPPKEKEKEIQRRSEVKKEAEKKYNDIKNMINNVVDINKKELLEEQMAHLEKKFVRVKNKQIRDVKNLFKNMGITYFDAPGEADILCARMVIKKQAYACVSDDMDMFVYGCPRVIRYLNINLEDCCMYNLKSILKKLNMKQNDFTEMCVLSGTDYNNYDNIKNVYYYYDLFCKINKDIKNKNNKITLYNYLDNNDEQGIKIIDLAHQSLLFDHVCDETIKKFNNISIMNGPINENEIRETLEKEGLYIV